MMLFCRCVRRSYSPFLRTRKPHRTRPFAVRFSTSENIYGDNDVLNDGKFREIYHASELSKDIKQEYRKLLRSGRVVDANALFDDNMTSFSEIEWLSRVQREIIVGSYTTAWDLLYKAEQILQPKNQRRISKAQKAKAEDTLVAWLRLAVLQYVVAKGAREENGKLSTEAVEFCEAVAELCIHDTTPAENIAVLHELARLYALQDDIDKINSIWDDYFESTSPNRDLIVKVDALPLMVEIIAKLVSLPTPMSQRIEKMLEDVQLVQMPRHAGLRDVPFMPPVVSPLVLNKSPLMEDYLVDVYTIELFGVTLLEQLALQEDVEGMQRIFQRLIAKRVDSEEYISAGRMRELMRPIFQLKDPKDQQAVMSSVVTLYKETWPDAPSLALPLMDFVPDAFEAFGKDKPHFQKWPAEWLELDEMAYKSVRAIAATDIKFRDKTSLKLMFSMREEFNEMVRTRPGNRDPPSLDHYHTLIRSADRPAAFDVLLKSPSLSPSVESYNLKLRSMCTANRSMDGIDLYMDMLKRHIEPNFGTFDALLTVLIGDGRLTPLSEHSLASDANKFKDANEQNLATILACNFVLPEMVHYGYLDLRWCANLIAAAEQRNLVGKQRAYFCQYVNYSPKCTAKDISGNLVFSQLSRQSDRRQVIQVISAMGNACRALRLASGVFWDVDVFRKNPKITEMEGLPLNLLRLQNVLAKAPVLPRTEQLQ